MLLAIYGAGGLGREIYEIAQLANAEEQRWSGFVFIDDTAGSGKLWDAPIYTFEHLCQTYVPGKLEIAIGLGEPAYRAMLYQRIKAACHNIATVVHPNASISPSANVGEGLVAKKGAVISAGARVGVNVALQHHAIIGHDTAIGDHCQISSLSDIAGDCQVGSQVFFGLNSVIKEKTTIGDYCIVGMGSCVFADIPESGVVMGNPAKLIKKNTSHRVFE